MIIQDKKKNTEKMFTFYKAISDTYLNIAWSKEKKYKKMRKMENWRKMIEQRINAQCEHKQNKQGK